jgi:hypothetical protein
MNTSATAGRAEARHRLAVRTRGRFIVALGNILPCKLTQFPCEPEGKT